MNLSFSFVNSALFEQGVEYYNFEHRPLYNSICIVNGIILFQLMFFNAINVFV